MTQARIVATDIGTLLYAHPGVALGALGMLAGGAAASVVAGASAANLSAGAGLSDPAFATLVSAAIGVTALLTLLTIQRFLRRRRLQLPVLPTDRERDGRLDDRGDAAALEDALTDDLLDAGILENSYLPGVGTRDLYAGVQPQRGALDDGTARQ